jgi:hypothetical protein
MQPAVSDSDVIIHLAKLNELPLIKELYGCFVELKHQSSERLIAIFLTSSSKEVTDASTSLSSVDCHTLLSKISLFLKVL